MDNLSLKDVSSQAARSFSGLESWIMATMLPSAASFRALIADPAASRRRAYQWVGIAALLPFLLTLRPDLFASPVLLRAAVLEVVTRLVGALIGLTLLAAPVHLLGGLLGGRAPYVNLEYAFAAWYAPLVWVAGLPLFRTAGAGVFSPLAIYGVLLGVVSVRAVYSFGWGKSLVTTLLWPFVVYLLYLEGAQLLAR
jgi:hypothetical protein